LRKLGTREEGSPPPDFSSGGFLNEEGGQASFPKPFPCCNL